MLKNKFIVLAILPFMLSACGGGGGSGAESSSKDGNSTTTPIQEKVTVDLYNVDSETLYAKKYSYVDNVIKGTTYYKPLSEDEFLLTADQLFTNTWVYSDTKAINALKFYFSDAPKTGYYHTFKKIDLSGGNVFDRFYPDYKVMFDKFGVPTQLESSKAAQAYNRGSPLFFPKGSYCYQVQEEKVEKPYITFSKEGMTGKNYAAVITESENEFKKEVEKLGHTLKVDSGKWKDYTWRYYREYDAYGMISELVAINYNGELVIGEMNNFEDMHLNDLINQQTKRLNGMGDSSFVVDYYTQKSILESLKTSCTWFNNTAAETIQKL
ncbi:hypothetical protein ACG9XS_10130 [Acinetobacter gyllenbergii]|uniref:hypothetical protein n=1 Tax=Acinetobacter gyllenbergii TaxID=134534 RepID=UPI0003BE64D7|nr:hypothetical protein [Acinetobacter gyllenbergii]ESK39426.1 hypothetical protein F987_02795 [Acinetobacter gyllenbergii NIPH 230]